MIEFGRRIVAEMLQTPFERDPSLPQIIYYPNIRTPRGMDIEVKNKNRQQEYEDACFEYLMDMYPNAFLFGPHYIDWAFGKSDMPDEGRMDAMWFKPYRDGVILSGLAEFKSGKTNGVVRKMNQISSTLERVRQNPQRLQNILNSLEPEITIPAIYIPPDANLVVKFLSPREKQPIKEPLPFNVRFEPVPYRPLVAVPIFSAAS